MNANSRFAWLKIFNENDSLLMKALKVLVAPLVLAVMLYWQPAKWLSRKAYGEGPWGQRIVASLIGFALSISAAAYTATVLSVAFGMTFLWMVFWTFVAFMVTGGIGWPGSYLVVFRPLWKRGEKILDWTGEQARKRAKPFFASVANLARKAPLAGYLWENVVEAPYTPPATSDGDQPADESLREANDKARLTKERQNQIAAGITATTGKMPNLCKEIRYGF